MSTQTLTAVTTADDRVLALINADRLPGQPVCTASMLQQAIDGDSPVDGAWWSELSGLRTEALPGPDGAPVGVVAYARQRDHAGLILWLHAREDAAVVGQLLDHALAQLADCPLVEAFTFSTALGRGLEALPVAHRPVTHAALLERGFTGADLWRYMHRRLPADLPRTSYRIRADRERGERLLQVHDEVQHDDRHEDEHEDQREGQVVVAEATIGDPQQGIGVLWWIEVRPPARGRGLGPALLGSALDVLTGLGGREVILYVDDDAPAGDPDRSRVAANAMYDRAGFTEIDRLWSYQLTRSPSRPPADPPAGRR